MGKECANVETPFQAEEENLHRLDFGNASYKIVRQVDKLILLDVTVKLWGQTKVVSLIDLVSLGPHYHLPNRSRHLLSIWLLCLPGTVLCPCRLVTLPP